MLFRSQEPANGQRIALKRKQRVRPRLRNPNNKPAPAPKPKPPVTTNNKPKPKPTPAPTKPAPKPGAVEYETYEVQAGDTLYGIAREHDMKVDEVKKLNNLDSSVIHIGQKLKVKKL